MEEYVSVGEVQNILLPELQQEFLQLDNSNNKAVDLLNICIQFEMILKQLQIKILAGKRKNSFRLNTDLLTDVNQVEFQSIMVFGAQIVFKVRELLLNETINLIVGGTGPNKEGLYERQISQADFLQYLNASLSANAVMLDSEMEKFNDTDDVDQIISNLWQQILALSEYGHITSRNNSGIESGLHPIVYTDKNGKSHTRYRKYYKNTRRDYDVYVSYRGKRRTKYGYYKLAGGNFTFMNQGWLYEWFREHTLESADHVNQLLEAISDESNPTPLKSIMKMTDTTPGYKGGDFQIGQRQMQAKYGNLRIISFTSIITVIKNLSTILSQYIEATSIEEKEKQAYKLVELFTDSTNMTIINEGYDKKVQEVLRVLQAK